MKQSIKIPKDLRNAMNECFRNDGQAYLEVGSNKYNLVENKFELLRRDITALPKDYDLSNIAELQFDESLADFIGDSSISLAEIETRLDRIDAVLLDRVANIAIVNKGRQRATKHISKSRHIVSYIVYGSLLVTVLGIVVLAIINTVKGENSTVLGIGDWATYAGIVDAAIGVFGFVFERITDIKNDKVNEVCDDAIRKHSDDTAKCKKVVKKIEVSILNFNFGGEQHNNSDVDEDEE